MKIMYYDIETTAIPITGSQDIKIIHAIGIRINDEPVLKFTRYYLENSDGSLQQAIKLLNTADLIIGFNSVNFDLPVIEQVLKRKLIASHLDLMLTAKVMFTKDNLFSVDPKLLPNNKELWGSFSLKAFGMRVGATQKEEWSDWSKLSTGMVDYMEADVNVTADIHKFLKPLGSYPLQKVIDLEHDVARIISQQERFGFYFDIVKARNLNMKLNREKLKIEHQLARVFKAKFLPDPGGTTIPKKAMKRKMYLPNLTYKSPMIGVYVPHTYKTQKNGKIRFPAKTKYKYFAKPHRLIYSITEGEYQKIKLVKFTGTDNQIKIWLKSMFNFTFTTYTQKGNIRVDRDDLEALGAQLLAKATTTELKEKAEAVAILRRFMKLKKDISQLYGDNGLIPNYNSNTHGISSRIDTNGTVTGRFTSSGGRNNLGVNLNQIPAQEEFRELFTVPTYVIIPDALYNQVKKYR